MIDTNCGVFFHTFTSPEKDTQILKSVVKFLAPCDVGRCELVCTTFYRIFYQDQEIWTQLSLKEGIPLVAAPNRNRRKDLQTLYPLTLSGARIRRILGTIVGEIPCISEVAFNRLNDPDPFEEGKLMKDTWVFVVVPNELDAVTGNCEPVVLDEDGKLIELSYSQVRKRAEEDCLIPLSLTNLRQLYFASSKRRHRSLFRGMHPSLLFKNNSIFKESVDPSNFIECVKQCNGLDKTRVFFMRSCIVEESRSLPYVEQEKLVGNHGFGVAPILVRALVDIVVILETATCPDSRYPQNTYAQCSDIVYDSRGNCCHLTVGDFDPNITRDLPLTFMECGEKDSDVCLGVAPCIIADNL
jgi:hypothetical protein